MDAAQNGEAQEERHPVVLRQSIEAGRPYSQCREPLREDFLFSCAYCAMMESEARGIGFEIDHYLPQKLFPAKKDEYANLMWSCEKCNHYKSDYFPEQHKQAPNVYYVIRPDVEDPSAHFSVDDLNLVPETETGRFNEQLLRLNRPALHEIRRLRSRMMQARSLLINGLRGLMNLHPDELPSPFRVRILKLQQGAEAGVSALREAVSKLVSEEARSIILDPEPGEHRHLLERRRYLRDCSALLAPVRMPKRRRRRGR